MYRKVYGRRGENGALPMEKGGSGEITPRSARTSLDVVPIDELGVPGKTSDLGDDGKLVKERIPDFIKTLSSVMVNTVSGPSEISVNQVAEYTISDYDNRIDYQLSAIAGTVSRNGKTITYHAGSVPTMGGFYLNQRKINVKIVGEKPNAPTITFPANGSVDMPVSFDILSSPFTSKLGTDSHRSTDWMVSREANFISFDRFSFGDLVNKTSFPVDLEYGRDYYFKCRYVGTSNNTGEWSDVCHIKTVIGIVNKPVLTSVPGDLFAGIVGSAFSTTAPSDIHISTDWQVSEDPAFGTMIFELTESTNYLTAIQVNSLVAKKTYYARARYTGLKCGKSDWTDSITFKTKSINDAVFYNTPGRKTFNLPDSTTPGDIVIWFEAAGGGGGTAIDYNVTVGSGGGAGGWGYLRIPRVSGVNTVTIENGIGGSSDTDGGNTVITYNGISYTAYGGKHGWSSNNSYAPGAGGLAGPNGGPGNPGSYYNGSNGGYGATSYYTTLFPGIATAGYGGSYGGNYNGSNGLYGGGGGGASGSHDARIFGQGGHGGNGWALVMFVPKIQ